MDGKPISFRTHDLTQKEAANAWQLECALAALRSYRDQFAAALSLFDFALEKQSGKEIPEELDARVEFRSKYGHWQRIAARDCGITLYNFRNGMDAVTSWLHQCPTLNPRVSKEGYKAAKSRFDASFRGTTALRHAIAHKGEAQSPEQRKKHLYSGPVEGIDADITDLHVTDGISGRVLSFTAGKDIQSLEVSQSTLQELDAILDAFEAPFRPMSKFEGLPF